MFIVIGLIALLVFAAMIYYVASSTWSWVGQKFHRGWKWAYIGLFVALFSSLFIARLYPESTILSYISAYWLASFVLLLLILPCVHLLQFVMRLTLSRKRIHNLTGWITLCAFIGLMAYGSYQAFSPVVRHYEVTIQKPSSLEKMNIVMASDMHFGHVSGPNHAKRMVQEVNALKPDLILIPGDVVDDHIAPFLDQGIDQILLELEAPYGVYASLGNHDTYQGNMDELIQAIEQAGIKVLYDEVATIADGLTLIGRKDYSEKVRMPLAELVREVDPSHTLILLDHQPNKLNEAADYGIDLVVSGHTHHGQIAPGQFITERMYENDWGYLLKGATHTIVSSGYGFWGPPIRLGSRSELAQIELRWAGTAGA